MAPTVPTYNGNSPTVRTQALPSARVNTSAPLEAFGGGASADKVLAASGGLAETVVKYEQAEKLKADQILVLDADKQLSELETKTLYDPKAGALLKKGKNAFGLPETVAADFKKGADEIRNILANDEQKATYDRLYSSRKADMDRQIQRHVAGEILQYDNSVTESFIVNERNAAAANFQDSKRIGKSIERQKEELEKYAARNGLDAEVLETKITETVSKTHTEVIGLMLAHDQDQRAKGYYSGIKKDLTEKDALHVARALEEGTLRGESQRKTEEIISKGKTRMESLDLVDDIKDPKIKDETHRRVNQYFNEKKVAEVEVRNELYISARNLIDKNPGKPANQVIPAAEWALLSNEQKNALDAVTTKGTQNNRAWLNFLAIPTAKMGTMNLSDFETKYWSKFDATHRSQAEKMWRASQDALSDPKKGLQIKGLLSDKELILDALKGVSAAGITNTDTFETIGKSTSKSSAYTEFSRKVDDAFVAYSHDHNENPDYEQKRKIVRELLVKKVFLGSKEVSVNTLTGEQRSNTRSPLEKIPQDKRLYLVRIAQRNGGIRTDIPDERAVVLLKAKIERAFAASANRATDEEIISIMTRD